MKKRKTKFNHRWISSISLLIIIILIISSFKFYKENIKQKNIPDFRNVTVYPTLYSNKHITENAKISDPKFRNTVVFNKTKLLANASSFAKQNKSYIESYQTENGTWLWTPILLITPEYRNSIILGAKRNGIKNIYLSIDSYLDIHVMPEGLEKEELKKKFDDVIKDFIVEANKHNITVDAEGGWSNWAEEGHSYKAFAILDYALSFNKTHKEKFRGVQYDVEPYMLDYYRDKKKDVLKNFINLIDESIIKLEESDLEFSVVIPEFYNGENRETPKFFYGGKLGYTFDHLLSILENRLGSKILVMSYRNFSLGENGTIDISKDEIGKANKYRTKIVLAQETGDVEPSYITYFKTSKTKYNEETEKLKKAFENDRSFNGLAVHYINTFMELK